MIIYPAIDIRGGRCVRLTEGRFDAETVFADDHQYQGVNTEIEEVKSGLTHHFQSSLWLFR